MRATGKRSLRRVVRLGSIPATVLLVAGWGGSWAGAQVFTVGEATATESVKTDFSPTRVELPDRQMTVLGRRDLIRNLEAEQGFAHRVLPVGATLTLNANGNLIPGAEGYKELIYKKGQSASPGDRVMVTALEVKGDRILIDLNGGPYPPHRFLRHVQIGIGDAMSAPPDLTAQATGCRIALVFEGGVPDVSAPEVKALLEPVVDFGAKSSVEAYAETLPAPVKAAIDSHEVLVGMNHQMVLASMGQPAAKIRESATEGKYEEWIYGHQPQTIRFVRFQGDRVSMVKVAAMGKPMEIHDQDELQGYLPPAPTRTIAMADGDTAEKKQAGPPTLKRPGETLPVEENGQVNRKVQFPDDPDHAPAVAPASTSSAPAITPPGAPGASMPGAVGPGTGVPNPAIPNPVGPPLQYVIRSSAP